MIDEESGAALSRLKGRLQNDPRFMTYVLAAYQQQESLDAAELARELGVSPGMLTRLALCKCPDPKSQRFAEQVREIADFTLTDEAQLANVLRQVDNLEKLARREAASAFPETELQTAPPFSGLLAAARDRDDDEEAEERREPYAGERPDAEG